MSEREKRLEEALTLISTITVGGPHTSAKAAAAAAFDGLDQARAIARAALTEEESKG